jgi:hypothetical protein
VFIPFCDKRLAASEISPSRVTPDRATINVDPANAAIVAVSDTAKIGGESINTMS